jgi:protein-disulfide isomerase
MASRKQQKEEARQRRLEQERAQAAQAGRRRRMQLLGGILVAAVAVIAVVIAISAGAGGATKAPPANSPQAKQNYASVNSLLRGIPQSGTTLGNPKAKVTMYYYGDLECPVCRAFTLGIDHGGFLQLVKNDVRSGKVKVVYKSFCTATCNNHPVSVFDQQQVAAYAAGQQHLFWDYADLFYREQGDETAYLDALAKQIPSLDQSTWRNDQKDPSLLSQVRADASQANQLGLSGTPSLVAAGPKGETQVAGVIPSYSSLEQAINRVA